jgi:hypothetical protein
MKDQDRDAKKHKVAYIFSKEKLRSKAELSFITLI